MKKCIQNQGITLIALVVTIIVLVILAGITISSLVGDNGIIGEVKNTAQKANEAIGHHQDTINTMVGALENISESWITGTDDNLGNIIGGETQDKTPPIVNITVSNVTYNSITITVQASDSQSGLADTDRYKYYLDNETEPRFVGQIQTYTYTDLASGVIYNLKVEVKDKAGNTTIKTVSQQVGIAEEMPIKELQANIGKYIEYEPISSKFVTSSSRSGYSSQTFETNLDAKWRIFKIEEDKLTLISDKEANTNFYLGGANGYNNGVLLLNRMCKTLYSNATIGATARSINVDDVDSITKYVRN